MLSQFFQSQKLLLCTWSHHLSHMSLAHGGQYLNGHGKRDIKQCAPLLAALFCISLCLILLPCTHTVVALQKPNICHTNGELKILRTNILSCYVLAWCPTIREKSLQMFPYLLPKMKHKVVPTYSERERKKKKNKIKGKRWEKKEKERKQKEGGKKEKKRREKETKKKKKGKKGKEKKWGKKRWKKKRKKKKSKTCLWVQILNTQKWDTGGGTMHDIASGQNLFLREVLSKTTAITTTELSGLSQAMIMLIRLEVKIRIKCLDRFFLATEKRDLYFPIW